MKPKQYSLDQLRGAWAAGRRQQSEKSAQKGSGQFPSPSDDPLVGQWFHSFGVDEKGARFVRWQGQVLAKVGERYLVQLYEWLMGTPSKKVIVAVDDMLVWNFYDSPTDMNDWYETFGQFLDERINQ